MSLCHTETVVCRTELDNRVTKQLKVQHSPTCWSSHSWRLSSPSLSPHSDSDLPRRQPFHMEQKILSHSVEDSTVVRSGERTSTLNLINKHVSSCRPRVCVHGEDPLSPKCSVQFKKRETH